MTDGAAPADPPARSTRRRWIPPLLGAGAILLAWSGGLIWFAFHVARPWPPAPPTQGIVALTGGAGRVETALRLLVAQPDAILLISGIGGGTDLEILAARAGLPLEPLTGRVTLGRTATSTHGNAIETRAWVQANLLRSITVVTAPFHMPRAMAELERALPGIEVYPHVSNPAGSWVPMRVLIGEYNKYLVAVTGLSPLLPGRDPSR